MTVETPACTCPVGYPLEVPYKLSTIAEREIGYVQPEIQEAIADSLAYFHEVRHTGECRLGDYVIDLRLKPDPWSRASQGLTP